MLLSGVWREVHYPVLLILFLSCPSLTSALSCYHCSGSAGQCEEFADPGELTICPTVLSLLQDAVKTAFDYKWETLPAKKSRSNLIGIITGVFNDSLPPPMFASPLMRRVPEIQGNTTSIELLEIVDDILVDLTTNFSSNICQFSSKLDGTGMPTYFRRCLYTNQLSLSDWAWLSVNLTLQSPGIKENCGSKCSKTFCSKDLCNNMGIFTCQVCQGYSYVCADGDMGAPAACPADHSYCIKEISGDTENRGLSARYCGTIYDANSVCNQSNFGLSINGEAICCSNRISPNCNSAEALKYTVAPLLLLLLLISYK